MVDQSPALPPGKAASLLAEADAAHQRCRWVIPPNWARILRTDQAASNAVKPTVSELAARSPGQWQQDVQPRQETEVRQSAERSAALASAGDPACDCCRAQ